MIRKLCFYLLFGLFLIIGCAKPPQFSDEYKALTGEWICIDGGINAEFHLKSNGKLEIFSSYSRNYKVKIIKEELKEDWPFIYYGKKWKVLLLYGKNEEFDIIRFNSSFDTILQYIGDFEQSNDSIEGMVRFIRKR